MKKIITFIVALAISSTFLSAYTVQAAPASYTITTRTRPVNKSFETFGGYNSKTKSYYVFRSYLEKLEKGGGTLRVKKGTYSITNTLYVPSNVKIVFEDGVVIRKGADTGSSVMKPASSIFQLVAPSKSLKSGVYGGYKGEKNISFIGKGKVTFDLAKEKDSIAIILGHNSNVLIKNINFTNMYAGHFIELTSSKKVTVEDCKFSGSKASENYVKEAINIDAADKTTLGYSQKWSKFDRTPCVDVVIQNNAFYDLDRAIGTHKYSQDKLHKDIVIKGNVIDKMRNDAIRAMNWENIVISGNTISNVGAGANGKHRGILASGTVNPAIVDNEFENVARAVQFIPWVNNGAGSQYAPIYDTLTDENIDNLKTNKIKNVGENFIRINTILNEYSAGTSKIYLA